VPSHHAAKPSGHGLKPVSVGAVAGAKIPRTQRTNDTICHRVQLAENEFFQGRDSVLAAIKTRLIDSRPKTTVTPAFALWGPPGQGKTQTALRFALEYRLSFSYIFWVGADSEVKLLQELQDCAVAAKLRQTDGDVTAGAKTLKDFLASTGKITVLHIRPEHSRLSREDMATHLR